MSNDASRTAAGHSINKSSGTCGFRVLCLVGRCRPGIHKSERQTFAIYILQTNRPDNSISPSLIDARTHEGTQGASERHRMLSKPRGPKADMNSIGKRASDEKKKKNESLRRYSSIYIQLEGTTHRTTRMDWGCKSYVFVYIWLLYTQ